MPFDAAPSVMANWPYSWRQGESELQRVLFRLEQAGCQVWPNGQVLVPSPFGLSRLACRVETWQPGVVFRFADTYPVTIIGHRTWQELRPDGLPDLLLAYSHPLRFSPYRFHAAGEGLFVGRQAEISLVLSTLPGLLVVGAEGIGKTSLLNRAARHCGTRVINCQAFGFGDWQNYLTELRRRGEIPQMLFLDELDGLLYDERTRRFLQHWEAKGLAWRGAVHRPWQGLGVNLRLPVPQGIEQLLQPLAKISGQALGEPGERLLQAADGNPRRLQYLCHLILQAMGTLPHPVTDRLVQQVLESAQMQAETTQKPQQVKVG